MKRSLLLFVVLTFVGMSSAQVRSQAYLDYIEKYAAYAVADQKQFGIPASITLAQGLLESGAGQSELARKSNNHFGIKCHNDWTGKTFLYDDDAKNECFRVYNKVSESYDDHSRFLREKPRYASLFLLNPTDYKAWAKGLKSAGYATDPNYANKLIQIIEDYDLHRYDDRKNGASTHTRTQTAHKGTTTAHASATPTSKKTASEKSTAKAATKRTALSKTTTPSMAANTESTSALSANMGTVNAYVKHNVLYVNGVKCVLAQAGDSYDAIASEFDIKKDKLLKYNDMVANRPLVEGEPVYLRPKKKWAANCHHSHVVQAGESTYAISQRYAMRLGALYKLNNMSYSDGAAVGQKLKLR